MYMHTYALCGYTRHLRTCRYAAIHINRASGISQAEAIAVNRTQGIKEICSPIKISIRVEFIRREELNWRAFQARKDHKY